MMTSLLDSPVYELTDPAGLPVGHVEVTVTWRFVPPSGSVMVTGQPEQIKEGEIEAQPEQKEEKKDEKEDEKADEMKAGDCIHLHSSLQVRSTLHVENTVYRLQCFVSDFHSDPNVFSPSGSDRRNTREESSGHQEGQDCTTCSSCPHTR